MWIKFVAKMNAILNIILMFRLEKKNCSLKLITLDRNNHQLRTYQPYRVCRGK